MKTDQQVKTDRLSIQQPQKWSASDEILLQQLNRRMIPIEEIALCLDRSASACSSKLRRLKKYTVDPVASIHRPHIRRQELDTAIQLMSLNNSNLNSRN